MLVILFVPQIYFLMTKQLTSFEKTDNYIVLSVPQSFKDQNKQNKEQGASKESLLQAAQYKGIWGRCDLAI